MATNTDVSASASADRAEKLKAYLEEDENLVRIANFLLSNITTLSSVTIQPGHKKGEVWKAKRMMTAFAQMKEADTVKLFGEFGRPHSEVEAALVGDALLRKEMICEF